MTAALLIIDMQKGLFMEPGRKHDEEGTVARLNALAVKARAAGAAVIFVQHEGPKGSGFHPSEDTCELLAELDRQPDDRTVKKSTCDAFLETNLYSLCHEQGIAHLVIGGCATDYCVDTTVRRALGLGYQVTVVSDGHTTAHGPHLSAEQIIRHHNTIWADFIGPNGPAKVVPSIQIDFAR
ncbi:MAG TPA: cysteine hydrolase family protein [Rhizomicrobium sp.]|nr:cysteine hydrolase family protein [Rhizomicrobium sp.]